MPNSTVCLSFDFDALSVWLAYDRVTPAMLNRGEYGARVGVPRILDLLDEREIDGDVLRARATRSSRSRPRPSRSSTPGTRSPTTPTRTSTRAARPPRRSAPTWSARWRVLERIGVTPLGFRSPSADLSAVDARAGRGAGLPLRLEPDDRRLPAVPPADRRPGGARRRRSSAGARRASGSCRCASSSTTGCTSSSTSTRTARAARRRAQVLEIWRAEFDYMDANVDGGVLTILHAPAGDRPRPPDRDARRADRPLPRRRRPLRAHGDVAQRLEDR